MKIVRIKKGKVCEIIPDYALPVEQWYGTNFAAQCVEAPDEAEQGWSYNADTGGFSSPNLNDELTAAKSERIAQSKAELAAYLEANPLTWTDGEQYSITQEKQNQLTSTLAAAQIDGEPPEWNTTGGQCRAWDVAELSALAVAIKDRVKALVKYQQAQEIAMNAATTLDELNAIVVDYDSVQ